MKSIDITRSILVDEPAQEDRFQGKGHERTAFALSKAIAKFDGVDRAIGLDGPWGSGKSSVVEIAEGILKKQESRDGKPRVYHFFTFDIWKSQGSEFRRSFLEHLLQWAKEEFGTHRDTLVEIEKRVKGKTKEVESNNRPRLDLHGILVLLVLPFLPIYYFWAKSVFDETQKKQIPAPDNAEAVAETSSFLLSMPFLLLCTFSLFTILWATWRYFNYRNLSDDYTFADALSQTLLVSSRQHSDQKITQHIREIDPNDYEFRQTLREILAVLQAKNERVVFVLDNIDRLPSSEIPEYWALVRSIFSRGNGNPNKAAETITAIVPYAHSLILKDDTGESESNHSNAEVEPVSMISRELFSKTFDEILTVSPPVMSNVREFFVEKMKEALPERCDQDELFRVYRIFTVMIQKAHGVATPRQIISFINDLSGEFSLHRGRFALPTVAAFIAYRNRLEENPQMLSEGKVVGSKIASLADDPDLDRNIAALTFNVEPELAFQILLDDKIKAAAIDDKIDPLIGLSSVPGFEDRVTDVVLDSCPEWIGTDEYGQAVTNILALTKVYEGQAKQHFCDAIASYFDKLPEFNFLKNNYEKELQVLDICQRADVDDIIRSTVSKVNLGLISAVTPGFEYGRKLAVFLATLRDKLAVLGMEEAFANRLSNIRIPNAPDFVFGLAGELKSNKIELRKLKTSRISLTEENYEYFQEVATVEPSFALNSFSELKSANQINSEIWVRVANALIEKLSMEVEFSDEYADLIQLLCDVWRYVDDNQRKDVQLSKLFESASFYQNAYAELDELKADEVGYLLFLAAQNYLEEGLPRPGTRLPNGQWSADNSDAFQAFKALFDGEKPVSAKQVILTATTARDARKVHAWVRQGASHNSETKLVDEVVRAAFKLIPVPSFKLFKVLEYYDYLKSILNPEEFYNFLSRYSDRINNEEVKAVTLSQVTPTMLDDTKKLADTGWKIMHRHVDQLLQAVDLTDWETCIKDSNHIVKVLCQRVRSSEFIMENPEYKELFIKTALGILRDDPEFLNVDANGDELFLAIAKKHHGDVLRRLRDEVANVSAASLAHAAKIFPQLLSNLVATSDKVSASQKDNLIRNLLCPALESDNAVVLDIFFELGRARVADFIKSSESTTKDRVEASCKDFAQKTKDRDRSKAVSELILGRRAKTLLEKWVTLDF